MRCRLTPVRHPRRFEGFGTAVRIVYLDQNKWIDLARAVKDPAEKPEVRATLEFLCAEAEAGHHPAVDGNQYLRDAQAQ